MLYALAEYNYMTHAHDLLTLPIPAVTITVKFI